MLDLPQFDEGEDFLPDSLRPAEGRRHWLL